MSDLKHTCTALLHDVEQALGVTVIDLQSGRLLGVAHNTPYFTPSYVEAVVAASVEMFRGPAVRNVENTLTAQRQTPERHHLEEVEMATDFTYHFMSVVPGRRDVLVVLITTRRVNLGLGWNSLREALPQIAAAC